MRTLPEPSNFNLCWTGLSLSEPLRIRGEMPPARINSITIYPRGCNDPPRTLDLSSLPFPSPPQPHRHRIIDVILMPTAASPNTDDSCSFSFDQSSRCGILRYPNHWASGFIAMRNFCVPNGTRVVTPIISRLRDGNIVRQSETLVAGITSLQNKELFKTQRLALLNLLMGLVCFSCRLSPQTIASVIILSLVLAVALYRSLYQIGQKGLAKHMTEIAPHPHVFCLPDIHKASQASQPSLDHRYWVMRYDLRPKSGKIADDLMIQFQIQRNYQKYWSLVVYDQFGLPIPQFYNLENIVHFPQNAVNATAFDPNDTSKYLVTIRLTCSAPKACTESSLVVHTDKEVSDGVTVVGATTATAAYGTIDLRHVEVGYVLFRIVHPTCEEAVRYSAPRATLASPQKQK
jgi:hypothetical protein